MPEFVYRDPKALKDHPAQKRVYDAGPTKDFIENVKRHGVMEPLLILPDDTIVSGHRRKGAAIKAGCEMVPCVIDDDVDPDDEVAVGRKFLDANDQREKTNEEKAREYEYRKELDAKDAKRRQVENLKKGNVSPVPQNSAERGTGDARKRAAEAVGLSHDTAEKAVLVVKKIDEAEAAGDTETASALRETLNGKSVNAAHRAVRAPKEETPKAKAVAYLKAAEKSLAALQDNCTQGQRHGAKVDTGTIGDLCRRIHALIERGRASL